jgi:predicted DCC family thiol-disulfide oxidoreductase YuxK
MNPVPRYEIEIDGDCGFCRRSAGWLKKIDLGDAVAIKPVFEKDMPEMRVRRLRDGTVRGGFDGFRMITPGVALLVPLFPVLWIPGAAPIGRAIYRWVARNRHKMPGASDACVIDSGSSAGASDRGAGSSPSSRSSGP